MFEDDFPFPKVGYVSFLEGNQFQLANNRQTSRDMPGFRVFSMYWFFDPRVGSDTNGIQIAQRKFETNLASTIPVLIDG